MENIPVFKPFIGESEIAAATEALEMGWLGMGSYVGKFEEAVGEFINASGRYVAALSTGHAALHLGLLLSGVGPEDEVITPAFNNIADFQAILATGANPVFCDIEDDTLCIDMKKAEELVSEKTKAIIVMDYDCILCDHKAVARFAEKHNLRVIHDAAHSFGSRYEGKMIGSFSDICMFSFDPVKIMTCVDGGLLVVKTQEELGMIHEMRLIGMRQSKKMMYQNRRAWTYDVKRLGFRYHMANLHAAIGLAQLEKIDKFIESRQETARYYNENLRSIAEVRVPQTDFEGIAPFLYYIRVPEDRREQLRDYLCEKGIDTGIHWQPGYWFTLLKHCRKGDLTVTEQIAGEVLSLPFHSLMTIESLDTIISAITSFFKEQNK